MYDKVLQAFSSSMQVITTTENLNSFCDTLQDVEFITIDTEFMREKTYYPKLCLIQVSGPDKNAVAVDPMADGIDLSALYDILENPDILKVLHSGRHDLEIFFIKTEKVVAPVFDTQIAAMVCGYGDSVGYETLVRTITNQQVDKSSQFTDWSLRPLTEKQIIYALGDVTHLCDVYLHLRAELEKRGRNEWLIQEKEILQNPDTYRNDPQKSWERIKIRSPKSKNLAILRELAAWREVQAQERDIPKAWVIRDEVLADISRQAPQNQKQLSKIRTFSKDMAEGKVGARLLALIEKAVATPKETWPTPKNKKNIPSHAHATIDVLKMLLKIQSNEHQVATKLIANSDDIEAIALDDNADVPALQGWRRDIFGADALALKHGKLAIGLKNGKIAKFKPSDCSI